MNIPVLVSFLKHHHFVGYISTLCMQLYSQFLITSSGFRLVNIFLRKFDALTSKNFGFHIFGLFIFGTLIFGHFLTLFSDEFQTFDSNFMKGKTNI